jgi:predicted phage terminase large subunit-like protein
VATTAIATPEPDNDRALIEHLLRAKEVEEEAEDLSRSLLLFVKAAWKQLKPDIQYRHNWHIEAICEHLSAVSHGEIKRLQIWVPPQSMKSILTSVMWPAWEWSFAPHIAYWTASYSTDLSGRLSAMSMIVMKSRWYQDRWGHKFKFTRDAESFFANDRGGHRLATSPTAETGTGYHGDRILIDDAINAAAADATSQVRLNEANNWWDGTVASRGIGPEHARVIIMQRLHENDIAAHALEGEDEQWEVLCLPERYEADHPYVWSRDPRSEGELLWPEYRPEELSNALARRLGSHRAAGQLQQRPAAREGEILKRHWWRFYEPSLFENEKNRERWPRFTAIVQSIDTPLKDKEQNDNVACQAWGVLGADRYLLDLQLGKMNYFQAKRVILEQARHVRKMFPRQAHYVLIENAGYGPELYEDLRRGANSLTGVQKIPPGQEGDKVMRATNAADALESGNCWLPGYRTGQDEMSLPDEKRNSAKINAFIENCAVFPNAKHDDDVDAWSQMINWLRSRTLVRGRTASAFKRRRGRQYA